MLTLPLLVHSEHVKEYGMVTLTLAEQNFIKEHPEITLAGGLSFEPYLINNLKNNVTGHDVDIAKLISQRTGLKINFELGNWSEIQEKAKRRELDGLSTAVIDEKRAHYYNASIPYIHLKKLIIVGHDNPKDIYSLQDMNGKIVALQKGNTLFYGVIDSTDISVDIIYFDSIHEVLRAVASGQADLTAFDESTAYIAQKLGLSNQLEVGFSLDSSFDLVFLLRNDFPLLTSIINKGLVTITDQEKIHLKDRWFKPMEPQIDYSLFLKLLVGMLSILSIILYWNYTLQRARKGTQEALISLEEKDKALKSQNKLLEQLSVTDHLTAIYNRVKLDEALENEITRAKRYPSTFGVIMLDIDLFKQVNDMHGHQVGDDVLIEMANILKSYSREVDIIGRWGGEEFLVISPRADRDGLIQLAEKLRQAIESHEFSTIKSKTASFGLTTYHGGDSSHTIIARADKALYMAKDNGRNRVEAIWL